MLIKQMTLLFLLSSCALFRTSPSLKNQDTEKLLSAVKLIGEGTGRLSLGQGQYVFGFDSILKDNHDWILAVSIPLHGEEVMVLPNLKQSQIPDEEMDSFELRIDKEFQRLNLSQKLTSKMFLKELRSLIRFNLVSKWGQQRNCKAQQNGLICKLEGEVFLVEVGDKELNIIKLLNQGQRLQIIAKNLTDSFFEQTDIRLYSNEADSKNKSSVFSLELFWKK